MELTIEDLKNLNENDWVYIRILDIENVNLPEEQYVQKLDNCPTALIFWNYRECDEDSLNYSGYGTKWLAYKNKEQINTERKMVELPCEIGAKIYLLVTCCWDCSDDIGDNCSCDKWLNREKKIEEDTVHSICFDNKQWYLMGLNNNRVYEENYGKTWFFTEDEAKAKLEELNRKEK